MKTAVRYFTKSKKGNTVKLADAIESATGLTAETVEVDLPEKVDRLFLVNAMYAANIDAEIVAFLKRNKDKIGEIVNFNTSATGNSTITMVKKAAEPLGIKVSDREFHCRGSWIFIGKGFPTDNDLKNAGEFAKSMI